MHKKAGGPTSASVTQTNSFLDFNTSGLKCQESWSHWKHGFWIYAQIHLEQKWQKSKGTLERLVFLESTS